MNDFSSKALLLVISIFSTAMIGIGSWIGATVVKTSIAVSGINSIVTSELPRLVNEVAIVKSSNEVLQNKLLVLETKLPYLLNTLSTHIKDHPSPEVHVTREIYMKGNNDEVKPKSKH